MLNRFSGRFSGRGVLKKCLLAAAALSTVAVLPAPAFAGGGHGRHHVRSHHHYYPARPYRGYYGYHAPRRHYYYGSHRYRSGLSGGEAALIAAGIIGGAILIDRALDDRDRYDGRRYDRYDDRYDDRRYDRYDDRYERRGAFDDEYYYRRDDRSDRYDDRYASAQSDRAAPDYVDESGLLGADGRSDSDGYFAQAAFTECVAETRGAAGAGGMVVALPGAPSAIEQLADGSVRMKAQFRASNARGDQWTRQMVCEADDQGVRFLQID
jgi:hypothetical protein